MADTKGERRDKKRASKKNVMKKHGRTLAGLYSSQILKELDKV